MTDPLVASEAVTPEPTFSEPSLGRPDAVNRHADRPKTSSLQLPDAKPDASSAPWTTRKAANGTSVAANPMLVRFTQRQAGQPKAGTLGQPHLDVRPTDRLHVYLNFDVPLHFYLLRLDTDGTVSLCWPESRSTPPPARDSLAWPTGASAFQADDAGAQAFVVIADSERMSSFDVWHDDSLTKAWSKCEIKDPIIYDGERFDYLVEERGSKVWRSEVPKPFGELCEALQVACPDQQVRAVCLPVRDS